MSTELVFHSHMRLYRTFNRERYGLRWKQTTSIGLAFNSEKGQLELYGFLNLEFDWSQLVNVTGLEGTIAFQTLDHRRQFHVKYPIKLDGFNRSFTKRILPIEDNRIIDFKFELKPVNKPYERFEEKSEYTDAILKIDGKLINANKSVLSMHSVFFRDLFRAEDKEKKTEQFVIDNIDYNTFILLMNLINRCVVPSSDQFESVLSLTDRFSMEGPKKLLEDQLVVMEDVKLETKLELAEQYHLAHLREFCIGQITCLHDAHVVSNHSVYDILSNSTKAMILDRIVPSIV